MKRIIVLLIAALVSVSAFAETYRTNLYSYADRNSYGTLNWGKWEPCYLDITVTNNFVKVHSKRLQYYYIDSDDNGTVRYENGYKIIDFHGTDEEGIRVTISLKATAGGLEIYFFYADCAWAYNVP